MKKHDDPAAPLHLTLRQADALDEVDESELAAYLSDLAPAIGWVIMYFNSLEDDVSGFIREASFTKSGIVSKYDCERRRSWYPKNMLRQPLLRPN